MRVSLARLSGLVVFQSLALGCALLVAAAPRPPRPAQPVDGVRIGNIQFLGDVADTNPRRLLRALRIAHGAPYDSAHVEAKRRELLEIGWLQTLDMLLSVPAPDSLVVVVIVHRAPRARLLPMLDLRADDRVVVGGQVFAWGRSGRGERFGLRVIGGGQQLVQAEWIEPRPFLALPLGLQFRAELFQEREEAEANLEFDRLALHGRISVPNRGPRLELLGSVQQVRSSEPNGTLATGGVDHLRRGSVEFVWGGRPAPFEWSAFRGRLGVGATAGATEYQHVSGHTQIAVRLHDRLVLASGWSYRDVRGVVPRYDRAHLGGGPALRAHRYGVVNGDANTWGGLELRVPANFWSPETFGWSALPFVLHVFGDAGTAWGASAPDASSEASERSRARMRWSVGIGATAYYRALFPIRVNLGAGDDGTWRTDVSTSFPF